MSPVSVTRLKQIKLDVYIDIRHSVLLLYQVKNILILDTPYWYQYYLFHYRTYCVTSVRTKKETRRQQGTPHI